MDIQLANKEAITKDTVVSISSEIIEKLNSGEVHPFVVKQQQKALEKIFELVGPTLTKMSIKEHDKYHEKTVELFGAEFTKAEFGTKYDYTQCGDPVYNRLAKELKDLQTKLKNREAFLKGIDGHETVVDESTGEIVTIYPPVKTSTTGVSCSIK